MTQELPPSGLSRPITMERFAPRVTVATLVERDGRFLFVEERIAGKMVINQPAGHLDAHESLVSAAARETLEETGWIVRVDALVAMDQYEAPDLAFLRFAFAATAISHDPKRVLDAGIERAIWLSRDELVARSSEHRSALVLSGVDAYLAGVRAPLSLLRVIVPIAQHASAARPGDMSGQ
jgi:8-oxo-dGTP pyrophosphatase MutT (NUDIX family)